VALVAAMLVSGCGFNLRGSAPIPDALEPLAVQCGAGVPVKLCRTLTGQMQQGGIALVARDEAAYVVRIENFDEQRRASALTQQGSAAEFDLRQSIEVFVITDDQVPLVANSPVSTSQTYRFSESNVLAKRREEESVRESLYQRLSQQVIFRLAPLTRQKIQSIRQAAEQASPTGRSQDTTGNNGADQ
jgi:LPS-assembly lipoprotein